MTNRTWARLVEILSLDVLNKGSKKSELFSVRQKIKDKQMMPKRKTKKSGKRNLVLFP